MSAVDDSWKNPNFRQSVINKINDSMQNAGLSSNRNGTELEDHIFLKARNKDEYLAYVARLILHIRETAQRRNVRQKSNHSDLDSEEETVDR